MIGHVAFELVTRQHIMAEECSRKKIAFTSFQEMEEEEGAWSHYPFQGHVSSDLKTSFWLHLLKVGITSQYHHPGD